MASTRPILGTQGYAEQAHELAEGYERLSFADVHADVLDALPNVPEDILDVGAGSGRDAAYLAALGHRVVAVEPVRELRDIAREMHPDAGVEWVDDALPDLDGVVRGGRRFAFIMVSAVWMHLDAGDRAKAMPRLASLLKPGGTLYVLTRHGPSAPGRIMHEVGDDETARLAEGSSLVPVAFLRIEDKFGREGITWSSMVIADPRPILDHSATVPGAEEDMSVSTHSPRM